MASTDSAVLISRAALLKGNKPIAIDQTSKKVRTSKAFNL